MYRIMPPERHSTAACDVPMYQQNPNDNDTFLLVWVVLRIFQLKAECLSKQSGCGHEPNSPFMRTHPTHSSLTRNVTQRRTTILRISCCRQHDRLLVRCAVQFGRYWPTFRRSLSPWRWRQEVRYAHQASWTQHQLTRLQLPDYPFIHVLASNMSAHLQRLDLARDFVCPILKIMTA